MFYHVYRDLVSYSIMIFTLGNKLCFELWFLGGKMYPTWMAKIHVFGSLTPATCKMLIIWKCKSWFLVMLDADFSNGEWTTASNAYPSTPPLVMLHDNFKCELNSDYIYYLAFWKSIYRYGLICSHVSHSRVFKKNCAPSDSRNRLFFFFFSFLLWDISSYQKALMILYTSFSCLFAWGRGDIELLLREGFSTSGQSNNLCLTLTKWNPNINILSHTL